MGMKTHPLQNLVHPGDRTHPGSRRRKRWIGLLLFAVALAVGIAVSRRDPERIPIPVPPQLVQLDPQIREHLARLATAAADGPHNPDLRSRLGLAFAVNGLWNEARQCFLDAIQLKSTSPLPAMYAAVALQELGELEKAVGELRAVVAQNPSFAPAWHRLGQFLIATGDMSAAEEAFAKVTQLGPTEWRGWAGLGEARLRSGDAQEALEPLQKAIALEPYARSARHLLGQAYAALGETERARFELAAGKGDTVGPLPDEWSAEALDAMKTLPDQFERADTLLAEGRAAEAAQLLQEALHYHPTNIAVLCRIARTLQADGKAEDAWKLLQPALQSQRTNVSVLIAAAHAAASRGEPRDALRLAEEAIRAAPAWAEARVAKADALLAAGRDDAAATELQAALEFAPSNLDLLLQLGDLQWRNLGQPGNALATFTRAMDIDPIHPVVLHRVCSLQIENGDPSGARATLAQMKSLVPSSPLTAEMEEHLRQATPGASLQAD